MTTSANRTTELCEAVLDEIERAVVGKRAALTLILTTTHTDMLAHVFAAMLTDMFTDVLANALPCSPT